MRIFSVIVIGRIQVNLLHQHLMIHCMLVVHMQSKEFSIEFQVKEVYFVIAFSNHNELLSVPTHSILLPGQSVSNQLQMSMLSAWQIVSLDYSEWIDSIAYADLDGTVWVARGDASTWAQNNPKFRPSTVRKLLNNSFL